MKKCSRCKGVKVAMEFRVSKVTRSLPLGLAAYCLPCEREYRNAWQAKNKDKRPAQAKQDRQRHPERYAAQTKRNRDKNGHPEYKRKTLLTGAFVENVSNAVVYKRDDAICGICKAHVPYSQFNLDHVIPLSRGGLHAYSNVQTSHGICNRRKHNKLPEELALQGRRKVVV